MPARRASAAKSNFELRLLGGATLLDPNQRPVRGRAVHRHRLALLAVLGRAHPGGVSRDRLIGLLWPERDTAGARHLLRQAIHDIRKELGPAVIGSIGDDVWLGESRVAVDVLVFEAAMGAGDLEEAAASYRGPFLDGFFLDDTQEFDEWMGAQRSQLAGRYESALELLGKLAESRDDHSIAARWWRVLAAARPSDSRVALRLIDALDAMRDRDGALAVGAQHVAYLRSEIGVEPDVTFTGRLARLAHLGVAPSRTVAAPTQAAEQISAGAPSRDTTPTGEGPARSGPSGGLHQRRAADVVSAETLPSLKKEAEEAPEPVRTESVAASADGAQSGAAIRAVPGDAPVTAPLDAPVAAFIDESHLAAAILAALTDAAPVSTPLDSPVAAIVDRRLVAGALVRPLPPAAVPQPPSQRRVGWLAAASGMVLLLAAAAVLWLRSNTRYQSRSVDLVAVLPFTYHGGGDLAYLGLGLPRLLTANLNGAGQLRTVDPIAIARATGDKLLAAGADAEQIALDVAGRFGAGLVVSGDVVQSGNRVRITAKVLRLSDPNEVKGVVEIVVDGTREHLFELVDDFSTRLVAVWGTERGARLTNLAARTTSSLPALRAYLEGEREYSAARYSAAVEAFERAVAADTGFALAYYRLSSALTWTSDPRTLPVTAQARRFIGRLSRRDSLLVEARFANSSGDPVRAERLYQSLLADYPDELEGWLQIAEVQFHWSATLGRPLRLAGASFARALALDSASLPPYVHLARIAAVERDTAQLRRLVARVVERATGTSEAADAEALHSFISGSRAAITRASAALIASHGDNVLRALQGIAAVTENLDASLGVARQLAARDRGTDRGASAELVVAQFEAAAGRWGAASAALDRVAGRMPDAAAEYRAAFAAAPFQRLSTPELNDARAAVARVGGLPFNFPPGASADSTREQWLLAPRRAYLVSRLALRAGDSIGAADVLRLPNGASPAERATFERATRVTYAEQAWLRGDARRGLALLGDSPLQLDSLLPRFASYAVADERFVRGSLLAAARTDSAALQWLETFPDASGYDLVYLAPAHLARAELHGRRGERAAADAEYRRFIALWKDCDPALRPIVDEARRRLGAR